MKTNKFYHLLFPCLLGGMLLLPAGCSNDEYDDVIDGSNEECIPIDINFSGIQTLFGPYGEEARNVQYNKIHETRDMDKSHMLETLVIAEPDTLRPPLTRTTSALTNTTLRLVAYDESNTNYVATGVYNISSTGEVIANSGKPLVLPKGNYCFHCFSPAQDVKVNGNIVTVDLPAAGGTTAPAFYYAKTSTVQIVVNAEKKASIAVPVLQPQYCKLTFDVNHSSGITMSYSDAVVSATLCTDATLALPEGTVTSNTPVATTTTISSSSPTVYAYPGTVSNFSVTVHSLSVDGVDKGDVTSSTATTMSMTAGNAYKASASITAPNYIKVADLPFKVARGNLLYNSTTGKWMMAPDQGYYCPVHDGGYETLTADSEYGSIGDKVFSYFNWGVHAQNPTFAITSSGPLADSYGGDIADTYYGTLFGYDGSGNTSGSTPVSEYKNKNDPCYAALGGGWHLPTTLDQNDFRTSSSTVGSYQTFTTMTSLSDSTPRIVYGHYFGTKTAPTSESHRDHYVYLPSAGFRVSDAVGKVAGEGQTGYGYYWACQSKWKYPQYAFFFRFSATKLDNGTYSYCASGRSLRCISFT